MKTTGTPFALSRSTQGIITLVFLLVSTFLFSQNTPDVNPCTDYKEPTIFCKELHTTFMPDVCMVEVWAKDFIAKASDNKTAEEDLIIAFDPYGIEKSKALFSEDGNVQSLAVYVIDECGNFAVCIVDIFINDNTGECPVLCPIDVNPWCGFAVITCSTDECTKSVAAIIDTRFNSQCPPGDDWADPTTPGVDPVPFITPDAWTLGNIGQVFGIAVKPEAGHIFLAATDMYAYNFQQFVHVGLPPPTCTGSGGSAGIYMTSFNTPETVDPIIFTSETYLEPEDAIGGNQIPNSGNFVDDPRECGTASKCEIPTPAEILADTKIGNGIGNIAYDPKSNHLFASNLEDGKIYSISLATNTITDVFDPQTVNGFTAYDHSVEGDGLANQTDRIWGIQIENCSGTCQLYFAREAAGTPADVDIIKPKEIYSVEVNSLGHFVGTENLQFTINRGDEVKITDLAFNSDCSRLLLAEKGNTHSAELWEYKREGENWVFNKQIFIGIFDPGPSLNPTYPNGIVGNSSSGGVSYGAKEFQNVIDSECDSLIFATGSCQDLPLKPGRCDLYGLQVISAEGNVAQTSGATDCHIDFDPEFSQDPFALKGNLGEVEVFNCCCPENEGRNVVEMAMIAGNVKTSRNHFIPSVKMAMKVGDKESFLMTSGTGNFAFENKLLYKDYLLVPSKDDDVMDGLSTLDMLILQKHLLGIRKLGSPYDIIAADVDGNESVDTKDLIHLRNLILGATDEFPSGKTWVFVASDYQFEDPKNPFPYRSDMLLKELGEDYMHADFVGIKLGDLDGNNRIDLSSQTRSLEEPFKVTVSYEKIGSRTHIIFRSTENTDLSGMQLTLEGLQGIDQLEVLPGVLDITDQHLFKTRDKASLSWISPSDRTIKKGDVLFSMATDLMGAANVQISSEWIEAEIYDENLYVRSVESINLHPTVHEGVRGFPNPFSDQHTLTFYVEEPSDISFMVYNQNGQLLLEKQMRMTGGEQQISLNKKDIGHEYSGIIFYQLTVGDRLYTGKALVIE